MIMKTPMSKQILSYGGNWLLIFVAVLCTFGGVVSAFFIPVRFGLLVLIWVGVSAILPAATGRYKVKGLLIISGFSLFIFVLMREQILNGAKFVLNIITGLYSNWITVPVLFPDAMELTEDPTLFIAATGIVIAILLGYTICLQRSTLNTILVTLPIVFLTFVISSLQADVIYLFGIIAVYLALAISKAIGSSDLDMAKLRTLPAFGAAMVIILIAYVLAPQDNYVRNEQISMFGNRIKAIVSGSESFGGLFLPVPGTENYEHAWFQPIDNTWQFNRNNVGVADAGRRSFTDTKLLEISTNTPGTFYLRGYSMLHFNGRSWWGDDDVSISQDERVARSMPAALADIYSLAYPGAAPSIFEMTIRKTGDTTPGITYRPYFSSTLENRATNSYYYLHTGVFPLMRTLEEQWPASYIESLMPDINRANIYSRYTGIDKDIAEELRQYAQDAGINTTGTRAQIADSVARHVSSSGRYTLNPGMTVPDGENFALYFLENIKEGYCIHFATTAVLLLRALDIPARFTSGYVVSLSYFDLGSTIVITDRNAHAWVEIFYDDVGWLYLEATPSDEHHIIPAHIPHAPSEQNTPAESPRLPEPDNTDTPPPPTPDDIDTPDPGDDVNRPSPGDDSTSGTEDFSIPQWVIDFGVVLACVFVVAAFFPIRRRLICNRREKHFGQKNTNTAAIYIWRYICRLKPEQLNSLKDENLRIAEMLEVTQDLALKARFSLHRLSAEERTMMIKYAKLLAAEVYDERNSPGRFWMKYIQVL